QHFHAITLGEAGACPHSGRHEFAVDGGRYHRLAIAELLEHRGQPGAFGLTPRAVDDDPHPSPPGNDCRATAHPPRGVPAPARRGSRAATGRTPTAAPRGGRAP